MIARTYILILALAATSCTTSRAVLAFRDGFAAEKAGDPTKALQKYEDAFERDSALYGAQLNRIRILALQPERRSDANALLDKLLKSAGSDKGVAGFAARMALVAGDVKLARLRLDVAEKTTKSSAFGNRVWQSAQVAVLAAEGQWHKAWEGAAALPADAADDLLLATVAWNAQQSTVAQARADLAPPSAELAILQALLARQAQKWQAILPLLKALEGEKEPPLVLALRAQAALNTGEKAEALRWAAQAAQREPSDAFYQELWAVTQISAGQPAQARDLLVGLTARGGGWTVWYNLAIARIQLGELTEALAAFDTAVQRCQTCAPAKRNRDALAKLGLQ